MVISLDEPLTWRHMQAGRRRQPDGSWLETVYVTDAEKKAAWRRIFPDIEPDE